MKYYTIKYISLLNGNVMTGMGCHANSESVAWKIRKNRFAETIQT